jgi:2-polyprenyl-3-methyl-5-hydroxy-6-metoxy-1,4-benzoquinol methylase
LWAATTRLRRNASRPRSRARAEERRTTLERVYQAIHGFFHLGASTADIGCGPGRDTAWLSANGYSVVGYDASEPMLAQA